MAEPKPLFPEACGFFKTPKASLPQEKGKGKGGGFGGKVGWCVGTRHSQTDFECHGLPSFTLPFQCLTVWSSLLVPPGSFQKLCQTPFWAVVERTKYKLLRSQCLEEAACETHCPTVPSYPSIPKSIYSARDIYPNLEFRLGKPSADSSPAA